MSSIRRWMPGLFVLLAACAQQAATQAPVDPRADAHCELDGMTLADYPGPKGQIRYEDGKTVYFCDTLELLSMLLHPEQVRAVAGAYTQDMAHADWDHPQGHWIEATKAYYVRGAHRSGSMGPTLASFAGQADAQVFAKQFGGEVLTYKQITPEMVRLDGAAGGDMGM
ncbi:nitrous oxide reductase accessory protein NosL [Dyella solisilvae]|uniref:Nitrous oxide reductase accessory protein NosL n=1 Tax=Dyella solisilvae TaxID=1920168 RepID=A0A370K765_9GAMM|nr:nitrous oxide reductase accessory protein NosL [Dyella solisilvae]RDI98485.1 nitrous oxide reductase accessory protein NosL [Dyella solisilvae]